ncbi:hypothetical protein M2164_005398 [Streptomyces sp. SAI-208]|nr:MULTISPECIES: hypothetical protein [unclassified Streptomyces]MDH6584826.1 hypothetical protein [Streptomyces sp. SAI-133]MDH6609763.1 hypothetical protein [Streptomyces sp. SAI-208]
MVFSLPTGCPTADNIVDDPPTPFPEYARELVGRTEWSFWWD